MRIAIDAMGGDNAPMEIVKGAVHACDRTDAQIILVGREAEVQAELDKYEGLYSPGHIVVYNADDVITGEDSPVRAVKKKPESSLVKTVQLVREGQADAALSAGNTGALMVASLFILGRIEGADRPAIASPLPNLGKLGHFSVLLDSGANAECWARDLLSFAYMGSIYASRAFGIENPRVGLINIGTEPGKGTAILKETYKMLSEADNINFVGNIEARDIPKGLADVLVCDGFTGNVVLKLTEGTAWSILKDLKEVMTSDIQSKIGAAFLGPKLKDLKKQFDYSSYGGAPILGVDGLVFKIHGSSSASAVENAIIKASVLADTDISEKTKETLAKMLPKKEEEK